jgi:hypothetical protein
MLENEDKMETRTNHHIYHAKYYPYDMTVKEQKQVESAYGGLIDLQDSEFVFYRNNPYFMGDCMRLDQDIYWDGYFDDTFFSRIVVKVDSENDGYIFGLQYA